MSVLLFPVRNWSVEDSVVFRNPKGEFGVLHNFHVEFPLRIHGFQIASSEHLYQAMRFTEHPEIQADILAADSPKSCKLIARNHDASTRGDWTEIREHVMRWVLEIKLASYPKRIGQSLRASGTAPIVEYSKRDDYWGAKPVEQNVVRGQVVRGQNVLGCLWAELRERLVQDEFRVTTPDEAWLRLLGDSFA